MADEKPTEMDRALEALGAAILREASARESASSRLTMQQCIEQVAAEVVDLVAQTIDTKR